MSIRRHHGLWLCAAVLGLVAEGCGGGGPAYKPPVPVLSGKLTKGGQPLKVNRQLGGYARVQLTFIPADAKGGKSHSAEVQEDGSFTVATEEGQRIPAGKYRVVVEQWDPYPNVDRLQGRFNEQNSRFTREIAESTQELDIDLDKP